ncbi:hypothetical protein MMSR116_00835 [Methylobacterium mesophilicum SR1.6/6]|uniref:Uncharacterized protein n=1 Tax=Methylobacterium mesophilicum SR1.6/6 TaxID=908290 RepID=A0A6B9F954_9HYPH|nr:hypothetical protein [Methylobacterium mesophilicum]QGY00611.1 hypothetical protein MMSR116_00835 [Methylobacterium mesophilicum SR1.6/6]
MPTFAEVHLRTDDRIKDYLEYPRKNYKQVACRDAIDELQRSNAYALYANNAYSRIAFAEIALKHVAAEPGIVYGPRCFVTISPARFAFSLADRGMLDPENRSIMRRLSEAAHFKIHHLQQVARQAFGDLPFIGMVEVALFPSWTSSGWAVFDSASWHCHLLAWGATHEELNGTLRPLRERHTSIKEGVTSVHIQAVPDDDLVRQFVYALKAPQKVYRTAFLRTVSRDQALTGFDTRAWRIKKDWLRTGQRVRLLDIMVGRTLDGLLFGNREGTTLARAIRDEALKPFRACEQR